MSRENIVKEDSKGDAKTSPKSKWFGFKYRVNPETSKALQEAVFKDGGKWNGGSQHVTCTDRGYLFVDEFGRLTYADSEITFKGSNLPEKEIAIKDGKLVDITDEREDDTGGGMGGVSCSGRSLPDLPTVGEGTTTQKGDIIVCGSEGAFVATLNSGGNNIVGRTLPTYIWKEQQTWVGHDLSEKGDTTQFLNNKEEKQTMARKLVTVNLWDDDKGLDVENSLVYSFEKVLAEDDSETIIRQVIADHNIGDIIESHNKIRKEHTNKDILNRTGQSVPLEPVKLKNLRWEVVG